MIAVKTGRSALFRNRATLSVLAFTSVLQSACYSYLPVQSAPPAVQERAAVVLTDRGRLLLSERIGATVERVEGVLVSRDSAGVVMNVSGTWDLRGGSSTWSGERVEIPAEAIMGYRPRQLSKGRTFLFAATAVAVLVVVITGVTLNVFGADGRDGDTANPPGNPNPGFRGRGTVPPIP